METRTHWTGWVETLSAEKARVRVHDHLNHVTREDWLELNQLRAEERDLVVVGVYFELLITENPPLVIFRTDKQAWYKTELEALLAPKKETKS